MSLGEVLVSQETIFELNAVLYRAKFRKYVDDEQKVIFLSSVLNIGKIVEIRNNFYICRDPKDNKFIDLAVNGFADFLITGDQDLLSLKVVDDTKIVTPRAFLDLLR